MLICFGVLYRIPHILFSPTLDITPYYTNTHTHTLYTFFSRPFQISCLRRSSCDSKNTKVASNIFLPHISHDYASRKGTSIGNRKGKGIVPHFDKVTEIKDPMSGRRKRRSLAVLSRYGCAGYPGKNNSGH